MPFLCRITLPQVEISLLLEVHNILLSILFLFFACPVESLFIQLGCFSGLIFFSKFDNILPHFAVRSSKLNFFLLVHLVRYSSCLIFHYCPLQNYLTG